MAIRESTVTVEQTVPTTKITEGATETIKAPQINSEKFTGGTGEQVSQQAGVPQEAPVSQQTAIPQPQQSAANDRIENSRVTRPQSIARSIDNSGYRMQPVSQTSQDAQSYSMPLNVSIGNNAAQYAPTDAEVDEEMVVSPANINIEPLSYGSAPVNSTEDIERMRARERLISRRAKKQQGEGEAATRSQQTRSRNTAQQRAESPKASIMNTVPQLEGKRERSINRLFDTPRKTTSKSKDKTKDSFKHKLANKLYRGRAVMGKLVTDDRLGIDEVSIGSAYIKRILSQPRNDLIDLVSREAGIEFDLASPDIMRSVINAINSGHIQVALSKSPVNRPSSTQRRTLRVHNGDGIRIHPMAAKMFNADYDGDDANVSFDQRAINLARPAMSVVMDVGGELNLDIDFFPIAVYDNESYSVDYIYDDILGDYSYDLKKPIRDALVELGNKKDEDSFRNLIETIFDVAKKSSVDSVNPDQIYDTAADIFNRIYRGNQHVLMVNIATSPDATIIDHSQLPPARNMHEEALYKLTDQIADGLLVEGKVPMNFQEFKDMFCAYAGEVENKNVAFRFIANVAKMYRYDERVQVGDDINFSELYEKTCAFAMSKVISNEAYRSSKAVNASDMLREIVLKSVGFTDSVDASGNRIYNSFNDFIARFVRVYQSNANLMNIANVQVLTNMDIKADTGIKLIQPNGKVTVGDVVTPLMNIYGDFTLQRVFGQDFAFAADMTRRNQGAAERSDWIEQGVRYINEKYFSDTLNYFKNNNDLVSNKKSGQAVGSATLDDANLAYKFLYAIANQRTSAASEYHTAYYTNEESVAVQMFDLLTRIKNYINEGNTESYMWADDALQLLYLSSPDMFYYYGMDNIAGFANSKYGKALMNAKNANQVASIRIAMLAEMRLTKVNNALSNYNEAVDNLENGEKASRVAELENMIYQEMDALASSSIFWRGIVADLRNDNAAFSARVDWLQNKNANSINNYWENPTHNDVVEVLLDTNITLELKEAIVSDVVRWSVHQESLNSWELGYQLELDTAPVYSDLPRSSKSLFDAKRDFQGRYKSFEKKSREAAIQNVEQAYKKYGNKPGVLSNTLKNLADHPEFLIQVSDEIYADALCSSLDIAYNMSEKSRQHEWTNAIYAALSFQRNGGYSNDVYRTDDRAIGVLYYRNISIIDIVKVLADPNYQLTLYDDYGALSYLSQASLVPHDGDVVTEADIWRYLRENPRVATAIRAHNACVISSGEKTGDGFLGSSMSMTETLVNYSGLSQSMQTITARRILRDHPTFGGMVALLTPTNGTVSRNQRYRYMDTEDKLIKEMLAIAKAKKAKPGQVFDMNATLRYFGITRENLSQIISTDLSQTQKAGLSEETLARIDELDNAAIDKLIDIFGDKLDAYTDELNEQIQNIGTFDKHFGWQGRIDKASINAFYSVRQDLNGAKTKVSTGIEGSETFELATWISMVNGKDNYGNLASLVDQYESAPDELQNLLNGMNAILPDGSILQIDNDIDLIMSHVDIQDEVIVEVPPLMTVMDKTTDSYGNQVSSVGAYLIIKRDNGAEKYNLKIKKFGDDGTDSITKFDKYLTDENGDNISYSDIVAELRDIYHSEEDSKLGLIKAKYALANRLLNANKKMDKSGSIGYNELSLSNYMCIADLMIIENDFHGENDIYLRSLEMIARSIKYGMTPWMVENGSMEDLKNAARVNMSLVGIEENVNVNDLIINGMSVHSPSNSKNGIKKHSTSWSRNFDLVKNIKKTTGIRVMGPQKVNNIENGCLANLSKIIRTEKPFKEAFNFKNYNVIGYVSQDNSSLAENVGPLNLWVVPFRGGTANMNRFACDRAYELGMTVAFQDYYDIPPEYRSDAIMHEVRNEKPWYILPCFEMRLNGSEAKPSDPKFSVFQCHKDRIVTSYEDSLNEYSLGDASIQLFNALTNRLKINYTGHTSIPMEKLFPNVYKAYPDAKFEINFPDKMTIEHFIVNGNPCVVDYGVTENSSDFQERKERVDALIDRYIENYAKTDNNGQMKEVDLDAGDIVGWAEITIYDTNEDFKVLSPIIPFDLKASSAVPTRYQLTKLITGMSLQTGVINDVNQVEIEYMYTGGLTGKLFKMFEGAGAANKGMASADQSVEGFNLKNGIPLDYCCALPSTASRRVGSDRRIKTMDTLMFAARIEGYNFGESTDSFPQNRDLADTLTNERIPREQWADYVYDDNFIWHNDDQINSFVKMQVRKFYDNGGNPSDFLASRFNGQDTDVWWEWEAMYEQSVLYENGLLKFLNHMNNDLCPDNVQSEREDCRFRICHGDGFDFGCLQMQVPHAHPEDNNKIFYTWENVYMGWSFFGEDFSGFHKPSINGSSMFMDAMNAISTSGEAIDDIDVRNLIKWAWADTGQRRNVKNNDIELDLSRLVGL